jgi:hypothetical protein
VAHWLEQLRFGPFISLLDNAPSLSRDERAEIMKETRRRMNRGWRTIAIGATAPFVMTGSIYLAAVLPELLFRKRLPPPVLGLLVLLSALLVLFVFRFVALRMTRATLRDVLQERDTPICLHCGYDLRGQTEPRCPECGKPFDAGRMPKLPRPPGRAPEDAR